MSDFLVNTKTGRYDLRSNLVLQYGRKELFHLIANGTFIDEDKWIERKKNSSEIIEDRLERKNQALSRNGNRTRHLFILPFLNSF